MILDKSFKPLQVCFPIGDVHSLTGSSQLFICIFVPPILLEGRDTERITRDMAFMFLWETHEVKTDMLPSRCESALRRQVGRVTGVQLRSEVREGRLVQAGICRKADAGPGTERQEECLGKGSVGGSS